MLAPRGRVGKKPEATAAPNASELLDRPSQPGERAFERDAKNPTEAGAVMGAAAAGHPVFLPGEVWAGPCQAVVEGGNDDQPTPVQKSDLLVRATKRGNPRGAKGEMG
jgi:hypothetical protein